MLKFFRKYRAWVLAVGGSILMVAFLLGGVLGQVQNFAPSPHVADIYVDGHRVKVRENERQEAGNEIKMFEETFGSRFFDQMLDPLMEYRKGRGDRGFLESPMHWLLLRREASDAGLMGGVGDARNFLEQQAAQMVQYNPAFNGDIQRAYNELIMSMMRRSSRSVSERDVLLSIAHYLAVERLLSTYYQSILPSDYRIRRFADEFLNNMTVTTLLIDSAYFIDDEPTPSAQAMQEHFEKYRAVKPGEGEFGIGYYQPDRVKLEYLQVDFNSILNAVEATGLDARLWYEKNRESLSPTPGQSEPPSYDDVADQALEAYKRQMAEQKMDEIIQSIKARLLRSSRTLDRDGNYRVLPDNWATQRISFADLRDEIANEFGVDVTYKGIGDRWVEVKNPRDIGDLARADRMVGSQTMRFTQVVESYREFGDPQISGLQVGLADVEPFRIRDFRVPLGRDRRTPVYSDAIFMRITAADPARPANSIDEVREEVIRNLKRIAVYERLRAEQDKWLARAEEEGLENLAKEWDARTRSVRASLLDISGIQRGEGFSPAEIYGIGRSKELTDRLFEKANQLEVTAGSVESLPAEDRTVVAPVPKVLGLAVARIDRLSPTTRERLNSRVSQAVSVPRGESDMARYGFGDLYTLYELGDDLPDDHPYSMESLSKKYQLKWIYGGPESDEGEGGISGTNENTENTAGDSPSNSGMSDTPSSGTSN